MSLEQQLVQVQREHCEHFLSTETRLQLSSQCLAPHYIVEMFTSAVKFATRVMFTSAVIYLRRVKFGLLQGLLVK